MSKTRRFVEEMTWDDVVEAMDGQEVVLVPLASMEAHGHHLPLGADLLAGREIVKRVVEQIDNTVSILVYPVLPFGVDYAMRRFPGTIDLRSETLAAVVEDIGISLTDQGFRKLVFYRPHGGNLGADVGIERLRRQRPDAFICWIDPYAFVEPALLEKWRMKPEDSGHAGETETSICMALFPQLVRTDEIRKMRVGKPDLLRKYRQARSFLDWSASLPEAILGDPTLASAEKGRELIESHIAGFARFLKDVYRTDVQDLRC